jgi:phosphoesterase RecJ-like protein
LDTSQPDRPAAARKSPIDWRRFVDLVGSRRRFLLTTHIRPDCDAIGSTMGMAAVLDRLGKDVRIVADFDIPRHQQFLDTQKRFRRIGVGVSPAELEEVEMLIVLDTSAWAQLGDMGEVLRTTKAVKTVLDHHVSGDDLGAEMFKDTTAEATGRIVVEAAAQLGVALIPEIARPLFAALATDTGWFRFASTSADTYRLAATLADAGAAPHALYRDLYENDSLARLRLLGCAMGRTEMELDGRLIHTYLEQADFRQSGAAPADSEDIVNMMFTVSGTEVALILVEQPLGGFKISFRSRNTLDCAKLAESFGGGGHRAAAGAFIPGGLGDAQPRVLDAVRKVMR